MLHSDSYKVFVSISYCVSVAATARALKKFTEHSVTRLFRWIEFTICLLNSYGFRPCGKTPAAFKNWPSLMPRVQEE